MKINKLLAVALSLVMMITMLSVCGLVASAAETVSITAACIADGNTGDGSKANPIIVKQGLNKLEFNLYTTTDKDWMALYGDGITTDSYYSSYFYLTDNTVHFPARQANNPNAATITWPLPAGTKYCIKLFENDSYNANQEIYIQVEGTATPTTTTTTTVPSGTPSVTAPQNTFIVGDTITFTLQNAAGLTFGILPGRANGSIDAYSVKYGWTPSVSGTSKQVTIDKAGYYVAAVWGSNWSFKAQFPFKVEEAPVDPYVNSGDKIVVNEDSAIDLSKEPHAEPKDKLFIGWVDATGAPAANTGVRPAGTVLTAKYVDINREVGGDLYVNGVQMRTQGVQGLRFIIGRSDALIAALEDNGFTAAEEGALAIPTELLDNSALTHKVSQVAAIEAVNTFPEYENKTGRRLYTAVLTNLTGKYARVYTVRGYVKFTDLNGNVAYAYSDEYSVGLHGVATTTLAEKSDELDAAVVTELESVVNTVKNDALTKQNALNKTPVVYADSGRYSNVLVNTSLINSLKNTAFDGFDFYHLGSAGERNADGSGKTEGDIIVGDITINAGLGADAVTIVQLSDLHFNYLNQQDLDEANPTLLSTYANRGFGKGNVPGVRKAAEFALIADQVVVTGDGIDYLSHGTIELLYREIWSKFPSALVAGGNHEYEQQMQGAVPDTLTMDERMNWVKSAWKHDYEYTSQMVGEKVMAIQMDNGRRDAQGNYVFAEGTAAKLEADLATAKANGYTVLVFCHVGLYTNNPAETDVKALFVNDLWSRFDTPDRHIIDFCNNKTGEGFCGSDDMDANSETAKVYNLLTNNAEVVKGVFNGHMHATFYTEIVAKTSTGAAAVIPQYTMSGTAFYHGHATKITVK